MQGINKGYPNLFGEEVEEDGKEGEGGDEGYDGTGDSSFGTRWCYVAMIDRVSEVQRISWKEVMTMNVYEFLNTLCYARDKAEDEKRRLENWQRRH